MSCKKARYHQFKVRPLIVAMVLSLASVKSEAQNLFYCGFQAENDGEILCDFMQQSAFASNADAEKAVDLILAPLGLPRNFVLVSCPKIKNAVAITPQDGLRYIVYDNEFVSGLSDKSNWKSVSILAHELGHHLCGHTLRSSVSLEEQREKELEADEFSGFILFKLGATLQQAQEAVLELSAEGSDTYSTHPNREKRLLKIESGYKKAGGQANLTYIQKEEGPEAFFNQGADAYMEGKYPEAITWFDKAVAAKPDYAMAYYYRGQTWRQRGVFQGAVGDFTMAIQSNPGFGEAYNFRGQLYYSLEQFPQAWNDFEKAVTLLREPDPLVYFYRTRILMQSGKYAAAMQEINRALAIQQQDVFFLTRGNIHMAENRYSEAIVDFTEAVRLNERYWIAYYNRGMAYLNNKQFSEAVRDFRMSLAGNPDDAQAMLQISNCLMQMNQNEDALSELNRLLMIHPDFGEGYYHRAMIYKHMVNLQRAVDDCNKSIQLGFSGSMVYALRGQMHYLLREYDQAKTDYSQAILVSPDQPAYYMGRAYVLQSMGDPESSCTDFKTACRLGSSAACIEKDIYCTQ
jgi:tetratricopeptide (TPR) repeat protein